MRVDEAYVSEDFKSFGMLNPFFESHGQLGSKDLQETATKRNCKHFFLGRRFPRGPPEI